jgi:hypothetical protein
VTDAPTAAASVAPDVPSAITAWRAWRVVKADGTYRLASLFKWSLWPAAEPLHAECLRNRTIVNWMLRRPGHTAPGFRCECGV